MSLPLIINGFEDLNMPKRVFPLLSDREFVKRQRVIQTLTDALLSAEAKAVTAHAFYSGMIQEVSTIIKLKKKTILAKEFLHEFVVSGWGKQLGQYVDIKTIEDSGVTEHDALRIAQLAVRSGTVLFAIYNVLREDYQQYYLSIHHALADEHTLMIMRDLVQIACTGEVDLALHTMKQGRQIYSRYVAHQLMSAKDASALAEPGHYPMIPVRLSERGRLAWDTRVERISLHRIVQTGNIDKKEQLIEIVLEMLGKTTDVVQEGNTVCSSRSWRLPHESGAIGMMTGLFAMPFGWPEYTPSKLQTSLEACARYSSVLSEMLTCCRVSELFINGAVSRGIPSYQVISSTFPVGIDIKRINASEIRLEIEGAFCSRAAANDLLNELAYELSDR
ncbi:hypothetical protein Xvie_03786 [Xenorhabdus vietnamensis]|uniref:Condensation domain-containing protein n=1 Tax=Xenorhabdus vietnamensis TaxID=351656 RepID=A0A1Y2S8A1_9GAMM|nr:hypothetical protein [Xenorhabdus vietnamensis]OTA14366.1 hypothetical protein Xvie_03786 [Xenorhabdus vietnamensis]UVN17713.1 hypothetical protein pXVIEV2_018 [Xenorhabdus vietnamensis]